MKCGVEQPGRVVDITDLPGLDRIEATDSRLYVGALARMSDVAEQPAVIQRWPAVSQALLKGASQQLRNMATIGGNLLQRTRCSYFRDPVYAACNKRDPGLRAAPPSTGRTARHAVLGTSEHASPPIPVTSPWPWSPSTPWCTRADRTGNVPSRSMTSSCCPGTARSGSTRSCGAS